jgi:hypothetical protein
LVSVEEQEFLTEARGDVYYITEHYRGYKAVLARLSRLNVSECRERLETAWRAVAPAALLKRLDGGQRADELSNKAGAKRTARPKKRRG